ncbi:ATP-binding protein [Seonamhaeicola sediminis]|uniref:ATP-binding protein n=1 Tax=Seonamhaeicola sediminis TaxID=2528206 RepID=A0A562Y6T7_9FLAO|nr:ATP-binding protein [Seonamhaeicola sediminis]TWO29776.1 ATP-binding protein [Seonamhaeicola sediminis]
MNYLVRDLSNSIMKKLQSNKVVIIFGARRVGKTVLVKEILEQVKEPVLTLNGEDINVHDKLAIRSVENYKQILGSYKFLYIDEAQKIPEIGLKLKLMIDEIDGLKIIISGSSSFDIHKDAGEPLTGRKYSFNLFALSENEYNQVENSISKIDKVRERLVFGNYPELLHLPDREDKIDYLNEMVSSYLLKDILVYENIKNSQKIFNLLRLIAFQIGGEVSLQELGSQLGISKNTVEKYLDLLSKVFILHKVEGFSRNLRKEITKNSRWYFLDNGIRNAVIANFNPIESRNDIGALWENYMISERLKYQEYKRLSSNNYFWRTYEQQEVDWVEERDGSLFGYEFKWKEDKVKIPTQWKSAYPNASFEVINMDNFNNWLK